MGSRRVPRRTELNQGPFRRLPAPEPGGCLADAGTSLAGLYLIGALPVEQTHSYEGHLLHCPACQTDCDRIGPAVDALAGLRPGDATEPTPPVPPAGGELP
ncbi:hypothetical protein [Catellatospora methionotrophica]|uniref:hypothetical protein n=1 Tax=Catellatospora methionotrophica TaxID=121620 RepID=UPI0033C968CC